MDKIISLNLKRKQKPSINKKPEDIQYVGFKYSLPDVDDSHIYEPDILHLDYDLYPHQRKVLAYMMSREALYDESSPRSTDNGHLGVRGGILALDMGLGKTLISLTHHVLANEGIPSLVVCSKSILTVWKAEIEKFYPNSLRVLIFHPEYMKKSTYNSFKPGMFEKYDIVVTTYSIVSGANPKHEFNVEGDVQKHGKFSHHLTECGSPNSRMKGKALSVRERDVEDLRRRSKPGKEALMNYYWRRIFLDESQTIRNFRTHTFKSIMSLCADFKWCLSGTPMVNVEADMWSQFRFCGYLGAKYHKEWNFGLYLRDKMYESIYILTKEQVDIKQPERTDIAVMCEMNENEQRIYDACLGKLKDAYTKFITGIDGFAHVLELFLRLRQTCVAPYLLNSVEEWSEDSYIHKREEAGICAAKIEKAAELIIDSDEDDKFLVFSFFKDTAFLISEYLDDHEYAIINGDTSISDRELISEVFMSEPELKVLFLSYKTGSEGLNLASANRVILVEPWWNPSTHEQAIARAWRNGQKKDVVVEYLIIEDTIENKIREICLEKRKMTEKYMSNSGQGIEEDTQGGGLSANMIARILGLK